MNEIEEPQLEMSLEEPEIELTPQEIKKEIRKITAFDILIGIPVGIGGAYGIVELFKWIAYNIK